DPQLAIQAGDVEPDITRARGERPRALERRERVGEAVLAALEERGDIQLAGAQRIERRTWWQRCADERRQFAGLTLQQEDFAAKQAELPAPLGVGPRDRGAALRNRLRPAQLITSRRERRLVEQRRQPALGSPRTARRNEQKYEDEASPVHAHMSIRPGAVVLHFGARDLAADWRSKLDAQHGEPPRQCRDQ